MKIERTKNAGRNVFFGSILKIYQLLVPFMMRTIMIYQMGIEYAGLNNLFTSIFQVLNLAELGIGAALTVSMYKPIAEDDSEEICALLRLYRTCFNVIGAVVLWLGVMCLPFLPQLISGDIPDSLNLHILYMLYLLNTVLSYWLFSYKKSLLYAHQRNDINSKILILTNTFQYVGQAFVLLIVKNYYLYLLLAIISQILNNSISAVVVNRIYPQYKPYGKLEKAVTDEIKKKVQGLITNKIGGVILRSADSIVVSAFLGLTTLAIYQNYYFILTAIISIISVVFDACVAGIGNSILIENDNKNFRDFRTLTFITCWLAAICCSCFLVLFQPFISMWVGREYLMEYPLVICMVVYFFIYEIDSLIGTFKDAAGLWYQDRFRPLITAMVNLILNIILVRYMGLYGVLLSTVISMVVIGIPWLIHNVFNSIFKGNSIGDYVIYLLKFAILTIIGCVLSVLISNWLGDTVCSFILKAVVAVIIQNIVIVPFYVNSDEFKRAFNIGKRFLKKFK